MVARRRHPSSMTTPRPSSSSSCSSPRAAAGLPLPTATVLSSDQSTLDTSGPDSSDAATTAS